MKLPPFNRRRFAKALALLLSAGVATATATAGNSLPPLSKAGMVARGGAGPSEFWLPNLDEGAFRLQLALANAAGGGRVQLPAGVLNITSNLPVYPNVSINGAGMSLTMESPHFSTGGTIIDGGSIAGVSGFMWNTVDSPTMTYTDQHGLLGSAVHGVSITNLVIQNVEYGIKFGALHQGGADTLYLHRVGVVNASKIGFDLQNCHNLNIGQIVVYNCGLQQVNITASGGPLWNFGNNNINHIISQCMALGSGGSPRTKGIIIGANEGVFGQIAIGTLTSIMSGQNYTCTPTCTSGLPDLGVPDLSQYTIGSGVTFSIGQSGFPARRSCFVIAMSGTSGAGTIQLSESRFGAAINAAATGNTAPMTTHGCFAIEIGRQGAGANLTGLYIQSIDAELGDCYFDAVHGEVNISVATSSSSLTNNQIVARNCGHQFIVHASAQLASFDSDTTNVQLHGYEAIIYPFQRVQGLRHNQTKNAQELELDGVGPALSCPDTTFTYRNTLLSRVTSFLPGYFASGDTIGRLHGNAITYTGAGGGSATLPLIFLQICGTELIICNPSSGALTLNTQNGQTINGAAGVTSIVVPANSTVRIGMRQTTEASGVFFWSA